MKMLKVVIVLLVVGSMTGCAGEMYIGTRRIDEYTATQTMKDKPYKCLFVECGSTGGAYGDK